jgi:bifunctional UDP-N-acetylglucosamine pyrophosphorylase/glucosamine-1-phosphate N-acetyltransferase
VRGFKEVTCVEQRERRGTGHATQQALPFLRGTWSETVLVLAGDAPLLRPETIVQLADGHEASGAAATVLTADLADPTGYGRIVRDAAGGLEAIVEERDATPEIRALHEINSGTFAFDIEALDQTLKQITNRNAQGEYYLTDTIALLRRAGRPVAAVKAPDAVEVLGINTPEQLAEAAALYAARRAERPDRAW